jgi:hypothetical protein
MKRKAKTRQVMVITPSGQRRPWSVPVAGFKSTKAVLAKHGYRVITVEMSKHDIRRSDLPPLPRTREELAVCRERRRKRNSDRAKRGWVTRKAAISKDGGRHAQS